MEDQVARHKKFGDSVYLQEPNLKSGCGGLRDYQNLLWITYFKEGSLSTNQLVGKDWLSESDQRRIERAYDFLLRLRTDLHYATGRATDILHINLQEQIATRLDYSPRKGQLRSEALMRDYYHHTRNILRVTERITEQFVSGHVTSKTRALFSFLPLTRAHKTPIGDSFFVRNKQLHPARRDVFRNDPEQMMHAFELAQERDLDLSPELEDLLSRSLAPHNSDVSVCARTARDLQVDSVPKRESRSHPANDASASIFLADTFPNSASSPALCSMSFCTGIRPTSTRWYASTNLMHWRRRMIRS